MKNSKNKTVVITGSSSGFGYLTTLSLARKGYKVWATMRNMSNQKCLKERRTPKNGPRRKATNLGR